MRKWLKRIGLSLLAAFVLMGLLLVYAYFIEPRQFVVVEETLSIPNWDAELNGFRVVAISDIHAGSNYAPIERLRLVVEKANEQNADVIVLLGDYVSESSRGRVRNPPEGADGTQLKIPVNEIADALRGFKARYGTYAIIGNHDWYHNERKILHELERVGIDVLNNEIAEIQVAGRPIRLWGIEDLWKNRRVPTAAFDSLTEKRNILALTHNPDSLLSSPAGISLMFAGHSHGGQINFPIFGAFSPFNDPRFMDGLAAVDGKYVYVTSGVGTSVIPFRWRVPPEIAVVTLQAAQ
ncbi:MAG TPA: metallophosphoesterase [Pyrinomonadaceae bacterium]